MLCSFELIILDNRSDKSFDVYNEYIVNYIDSCKISYVKDEETLTVTKARKKLVEIASGQYVWLTNVSDIVSGVITDELPKMFDYDVICFGGYDCTQNKRIGNCVSKKVDLTALTVEQKYELLSNSIQGVWSMWFKTSFIKNVFTDLSDVSLSKIENVFLKSYVVSKALNIFISPEIIYKKSKKDAEQNELSLSDFNSIINEISYIKTRFNDNYVVLKSLEDSRLVKEYVDKFINYFSGTDQELKDTATKLLNVFEIDKEGVENLVTGLGQYNQFNLTRLQVLCGLKNHETIDNSNTYSGKSPANINETMYGVNGLMGKVPTTNTSLTICIVCYDGDYESTENLVKYIKANTYLKGVDVLVINNCINNSLEKVDGVKYIDTNENLYAYRSRLLASKSIDTDFLWFVDGDDSINVDFNILNVLHSNGTDITFFTGVSLDNHMYNTRLDLANAVLLSSIDTSLHRCIFSKRIYKKLSNLPNNTFYLGEDVFIQAYSLMNSDTISLVSGYPELYSHTESNHYLNNNFYIGLNDLFNTCKEYLPYVIYKNVIDKVVRYVSERASIEDFEKIDISLPYLRNTEYKNFDNVNTPIVDKGVDIVYLYYGSNLDDELSKIEEQVKCKHNVIVIDIFGNSNNANAIKGLSLKECLLEAVNRFVYNHTWVIESYKHIFIFNGYHLNDITTYFNSNDTDCYNPLSRNNVIFLKNDFVNFINLQGNDLSLGNLSPRVYEYCTLNNTYKCDCSLVKAIPFDEKEITFFFINLDGFLENNPIAKKCVESLKCKFPKSNIVIHTDETLKDIIQSSEITKELIKLRKTTDKYRNFENDLLRLYVVNSKSKSIYIDMDIIIENKNKFLTDLSIFPTFCQYGVTGGLQVYNELLWSLGESTFINENINFYNNKSVEEITDENSPLYNSAVANELIKTHFGRALGSNVFNVLDLCCTDVVSDPVQFHFRSSRYSYFGDKDEIRIGIMHDIDASDNNVEFFTKNGNVDALYILSDWVTLGYYHSHINDCEVTSIGLYKSPEETINLLIRSIENSNTNISEIRFFNLSKDKTEIGNHSVIQYFNGAPNSRINYRRIKLKEYLSSNYDYVLASNIAQTGECDVLIISKPEGWVIPAHNIKHKCLVYDRSDYWSCGINNFDEDDLIRKADIVFNSSEFLFKDSKSKREMQQPTYFIPNGCTVKEYKPVEKYPNPTAVYIGKPANKVDWEKIKEVSKDYKVLIYGDFKKIPDGLGDNVEYKGYLDEYELHNELCKCHVGLIPFIEGDWTRGMLPLKLFHYANAHIPTLYWNCPECDNYPTIASSTEVLNPTDEDFNKVLAEADWNAKFKAMLGIIEDNMKGFAV